MGCDIHIIAEVKENGVWRANTDKVFKNPYYERYKEIKLEDPARFKEMKKWVETRKLVPNPSRNRHYNWFSVLADVRNGHGFAGIKTGEGFEVIAQPKGFPKDASREAMELLGLVIDDSLTMEEYEESGGEFKDEKGNYYYRYPRLKVVDWGCSYLDEAQTIAENVDYHSYSYLTAKELDEFDWSSKMTMLRGVISLSEYEELKPTGGEPKNGYSGAVSGRDIVTVDEHEADKILKVGLESSLYAGKSVNVNYHWMINYKEYFKHELKNTVEPLKKLANKYEDARIVFAFDN